MGTTARGTSSSSVLRACSLAAAAALSAGLLAAVAPPASAAVAACSGAIANGLSVDATHATSFFTDLGKGLDASYVGYKITNNSANPLTNVWVKLSGFTGGSVTLADSSDDQRQIVSLPVGQSGTTFFFVKASATTATAQTHTVTVYDRRPDLVGAASLATCTFSFTAVSDTTEASANKVTNVSAAPLDLAIGQTVTVTVDGQTGTVGNGMMWMSPAAKSAWPTKSLRLESTQLAVDKDGNGTTDETYNQTLSVPATIASTYTSSTKYRATYVFRLTKATATNPTVQPVSQIYSGGQYKHSPLDSATTLSSSSVASGVVLSKSMTAADMSALPTTTSPNGVAGATRYIEVPFRVRATAVGGSAVIDEIVDVPASGVIFKHGSARLTDSTPYTSATIADPVTAPGDSGVRAGALHFTGPFYASVATPAQIDYVVYIPVTAGTYSNQGFATINGVTIGSTPTTVPIVNVTTNGTGVTGATTGTTGAGTSAQTVTFATPSPMTLLGGTQSVSPTASSGLAVTLTSDTASICTVSGTTITSVASGTCSITATQVGDASWAAATPVTRTFTVSKASQSITFATPSAMTLLGGTQSVSPTASSGLAVTLVSDTTSICTVSGSTITAVASGTCSITASQAGSTTYAAAPTVTRTFAVSKAAQTITFPALPDVTLGAVATDLTATASSGLAVAYTTTTPTVCSVDGGTTVHATAGGTCTVVADQVGDATYAAATSATRSFTVVLPGSTPQSITFTQPGALLVAQHESLTATATSGLTVRFVSETPEVCTVSGTTVSAVGVGDCIVTASQAGSITYAAAADVSRTLVVSKAPQTISFVPSTSLLMTDGPRTLTATATSGLAVSFTAGPAEVCTVVGTTLTLVGAGTCTVVASQPGDDDWSTATQVSVDIAVARVPQTVDFAQPSAMHLLDADQALVAEASSGLAVTFSSLTTDVCTVVDGAVHVIGDGSCALRATQVGDAVHEPAHADVALLVSKAVQSVDVTAPADLDLPDGSLELDGTATSTLAVSYTSLTTGTCSVDGATVTAVAEGVCQVQLTQAGDATYAAATPVTVELDVHRIAQAISFALPATAVVTGDPIALEATSDSGLAVTYTVVTPLVCEIVDGRLQLLATGRCSVTASQAGDAVHLAATPVTEFVDVSAAGQTITAGTPEDLVVTDGPVDLTATATSGLPVTWVSDTPDVCVVDGDAVSPVAAGECSLTASQAGSATYAAAEPVTVSFDVLRAAQTITVAPVAAHLAIDADFAVGATATSGLGVQLASTTTDVCTVVDGLVHLAKAGTCTLTATQAGSDRFLAATPVDVDIVVDLAPQAIDLVAPDELLVTADEAAVTATADSGLAVTVTTTTPDVCTIADGAVRPLKTGTCTVLATRAATEVYAAATDASADIDVVRAPQTVSFAQPGDIVATAVDRALAATATSGLDVAFAAGPADVCTVVDGALHPVGSGECTVTASQDGSDRYLAAPDVVRTLDVVRAEQTIAFEPAESLLMTASPVVLDATATSGLDVTLTSATPLTCTVDDGALVLVAAGTCRLVATQPGDSRFDAATAVVRDVTIARAPQTLVLELVLGAVLAESPLTFTATTDSGLDVSVASGTPTVCRVVDGALVLLKTGDCLVTASQSGDARYLPAEPVTRTLAVRTQAQTITLAPVADLDADEGPVSIDATSTSGLAVALASETPEVCTVEDGTVVLLAHGTCTIVATQDGNATVAPAEPVRTGFVVRALPQTITATELVDITMLDDPQPLAASATSGLDVAAEVLDEDVCVLEDGALRPTGAGTCRVRLTQPGAGWYEAAEPVVVEMTVSLAPQSVHAGALADVTMVDEPQPLVVSATSGLDVGVEVLDEDVCALDGGALRSVGAGTCRVRLTQPGDARYAAAEPVVVEMTISLAPQSIRLAALDDMVVGDAAQGVTVSASSGLDVALASTDAGVCTIEGATVLPVAVGTCTLIADQPGSTAYAAAARVSVSFDVLPPLAASNPEIGQLDLESTVDTVVPVVGGVAPYAFAVTDGGLPEGLVLDPETGAITGTAAAPGQYEVTVLVTDAGGRTSEVVLSLRVMGGAPVAQLPALDDSAVTMTAGTSTVVDLPVVPDATTWEIASDTVDLVVTDLGDGTLRLAAVTSLSGVRHVVLTATLGAQTASATITVTVVPQAPAASSYTPGDGVTTVIRWSASATRTVVAYRVFAGTRLVATTRGTSATVRAAYGPATQVRVAAVGAQSTVSSRTAASYAVPVSGRAHVTARVQFATSSWTLDLAARRALDRLAALARAGGFTHLSLVGHTDSRGSMKYNYWLSHRRVLAVRAYLATSAPAVRLDQAWAGETSPVATNNTAAGRALNRRVDVAVW